MVSMWGISYNNARYVWSIKTVKIRHDIWGEYGQSVTIRHVIWGQ